MEIKKKKIVIVGARIDGYASAVWDAIDQSEDYEIIGFIDNSPELLYRYHLTNQLYS